MRYNYLLLFLVLIFISFNLSGYQIDSIHSKITIRDDGILQISDSVIIKNVDHSIDVVLPLIPVYDLKVNSSQKSLSYIYSLDSLIISVSDCCLVDNSLFLEIVYLTDRYTSKKEGLWSIDYYPIFNDYTDSLEIKFPEYTEIRNVSTDLRFISPEGNKFVLSYKDPVSSFKVDYLLKPTSFPDRSFSFLNFLIPFFIAFTLTFFGLRKYNKYKKNNLNNKDELLLGLNENEQKIIKVVIEKNGILQKYLDKETSLPKGTVSRNLKKLENKGYVSIKSFGVNNKVFLGNVFLKK
jgi:uncharacterized membrane protein